MLWSMFVGVISSSALVACSEEADIRSVWQSLPHPEDVRLDGSIQQMAAALSESVELPAGYVWVWEHVEEDWDQASPLVVEQHGLRLTRAGMPGDGSLPEAAIDLIEDVFGIPIAEVDRYAVQGHRIVFLAIGPVSREGGECDVVALLADLRLVSGGGTEKVRWRVMDSTPLSACPIG